jgi:hypothetical protein
VDEVAVHEIPVPSIECRLPLAALGLYVLWRSEGNFWFAHLTGSNGLQLGLVSSHEGCCIFSHHGGVRRHWSGCSLPVECNPIGQCTVQEEQATCSRCSGIRANFLPTQQGAHSTLPACGGLAGLQDARAAWRSERRRAKPLAKAPLPAAFWARGKLGDAVVFLVRACCSQDIFTIAPLQVRSERSQVKLTNHKTCGGARAIALCY